MERVLETIVAKSRIDLADKKKRIPASRLETEQHAGKTAS